ncbi:unnamed protein product [Rangifer tarandus platyrhynchus]|uniref:Uncharacterized protein n=2 Tax=Rangifer tarandus platyrhynchus TaxID=3082113 RepID=A0ABN9A0P1_RANTA|nr:unnamed protein product [Rangifer tarandus platyrhynchus]
MLQSLEVGPRGRPRPCSHCPPPGAGRTGPGLHSEPDRGGSEGDGLSRRERRGGTLRWSPRRWPAPPGGGRQAETCFLGPGSRVSGAGVGATGPGPRTRLKSAGFSGLQSRETPASVPAGGSFREPPTFS